jgi:hypothetical protein
MNEETYLSIPFLSRFCNATNGVLAFCGADRFGLARGHRVGSKLPRTLGRTRRAHTFARV